MPPLQDGVKYSEGKGIDATCCKHHFKYGRNSANNGQIINEATCLDQLEETEMFKKM